MKVETNNYSAEFGNAAGGIISAIIKSGSNSYHGSLFEYGRNDALDANSWENNRSQAKKAQLSQNIFGGTLGGPLIKNRVFFFADYQGTRFKQRRARRDRLGCARNLAPGRCLERDRRDDPEKSRRPGRPSPATRSRPAGSARSPARSSTTRRCTRCRIAR